MKKFKITDRSDNYNSHFHQYHKQKICHQKFSFIIHISRIQDINSISLYLSMIEIQVATSIKENDGKLATDKNIKALNTVRPV